MSEISNYEAQKKKLQGLCDEHNFTFRFFKDRYPITLVITPINDIATQIRPRSTASSSMVPEYL